MAVAAHPDDIEFLMAGTLLLLKERGFEIHYMTLSSGNCGSMSMSAAETRMVRRAESLRAARRLGAVCHPSIADDLEILYDLKLLRRLAATMREVAPEMLLIPSPQDYMEDHVNTCRLAVTAAFARGMPNFKTNPAREPVEQEVTLYHAMPHGLRDALRQPIEPELFVNTAEVHELKRQALAEHRSQKEWLDVSQGMDSYLAAMDEMSLALGRASKRFKHAEGWRRHSHLGFASKDRDALREVLGKNCVRNLKHGRR
jgi:LmbE family N-acetylglucosaminyl deacetylase